MCKETVCISAICKLGQTLQNHNKSRKKEINPLALSTALLTWNVRWERCSFTDWKSTVSHLLPPFAASCSIHAAITSQHTSWGPRSSSLQKSAKYYKEVTHLAAHHSDQKTPKRKQLKRLQTSVSKLCPRKSSSALSPPAIQPRSLGLNLSH